MANMNRRDFIKVLGTVSAAGCNIPEDFGAYGPKVPLEQVLPYVVTPEEIVPGVSTWFKTACTECAAGCGVSARNREGRIVKLEGNPEHPTNQGSLCSVGQAALLETYSADRFDGPTRGNQRLEWDTAIQTVADAVKASKGKVAWLGRYRSGSLATLVGQFTQANNGKRVHWEPLGHESLREATRQVYGKATIPTFHLEDARTIVSFGADFLHTWLNPTEHSRGFGKARNPHHGGFVTELVCIEPRIGTSSSNADLHLAPKPGTELSVALAIAKLVVGGNSYAGPAADMVSGTDVDAVANTSGIAKEDLQAVADKINASGPSVILPGGEATSSSPTDLAIAALVLNEVAGNLGKTVRFGPEHNTTGWSSYSDVAALLDDCADGDIGVLFVDGLDPVYALPSDARAAEALSKVGLVVFFDNEPSDSHTEESLILPPGSTVEGWGDNEAITGRFTLQQPAMKPLKNTRGIGDVLLAVAKGAGLTAPTRTMGAATFAEDTPMPDTEGTAPGEGATVAPAGGGAAIVEETLGSSPIPGFDAPDYRTYLQSWWRSQVYSKVGSGSFSDFWVDALQRGGVFVDQPHRKASFQLSRAPKALQADVAGSGDFVLALFPHPFILDGRHANKSWAQEVPEPVSTYTWSSWVEINPKTAEKLGLAEEDTVKVTTDKGTIEVSWFGSPGIREDTIAAVMGNGHKASGRYSLFGANPMTLIPEAVDATSGALKYVATKASVKRSANKRAVKQYAGSLTQEGRPINYPASAEDYLHAESHTGLGHHGEAGKLIHLHGPPIDERLIEAGLLDFYPEPEHPTYRFALAIDLNSCTGCGACETACYAENNIPVVGPDQINLSRHMGWIRLSRYWEGEGKHPDIRWQPVMCQHCAHAPCEGVCPVLATYHNIDGLNAMIYNRCVGTRYCGNNCPYSARRFNYHSFDWPESFHMMLNPDVVVREMGVMEKCTFCIQRLRDAKDAARDEGRAANNDELKNLPACVSACPSNAMVFGNENDTSSDVSRAFHDIRSWFMLTELNTKPGVKYLARLVHHDVGGHHGGGGGHGGGHGDGGDHATGDDDHGGGHH